MPDRPMAAPDSRKGPAGSESVPPDATARDAGASVEAELAKLASRFAQYGGGNFSPEFSTHLALEVVLNEIVEQACLATGASGAAILLERDGEMLCRARSGAMVPEIGARLENGSGISQACVTTRRAQRCDDAQSDPWADREASRRLGIRSVLVVPLLRNGEMAGLLEVFSTRASAFQDRDRLTLEALAPRVLQSVERVASASLGPAKSEPVAAPRVWPGRAEDVREAHNSSTGYPLGQPLLYLAARQESGRSEEERDEETEAVGVSRGMQVVTWALGMVVLGFAVLLGVLVVQRLGWRHDRSGHGVTRAVNAIGEGQGGSVASGAGSGAAASSGGASQASDPGAKTGGASSSGSAQQLSTAHKSQTADSGELMIYQNGREVFRMLPARSGMQAEDIPGAGVEPASAVEDAGGMKLSSSAAENNLLHRVEPDYPEEARREKIQGAVVLDVRIDGEGAVQEVKLVNGPELLAQAAIAAVKQWRFKARTVDGRPVEMQTRITLNFRLPQ